MKLLLLLYCIKLKLFVIKNNIIILSSMLTLIFNIRLSYTKYSTYENFKEYYNLDIINNTPLILNKMEP